MGPQMYVVCLMTVVGFVFVLPPIRAFPMQLISNVNANLRAQHRCDTMALFLGVNRKSCRFRRVEATMKGVAQLANVLHNKTLRSYYQSRLASMAPTNIIVNASFVPSVARRMNRTIGVVPLRGCMLSITPSQFLFLQNVRPPLEKAVRRWGAGRVVLPALEAEKIADDVENAVVPLLPLLPVSAPPLRFSLLRAASPRLVYLHQTLSVPQCESIIDYAAARLSRNKVVVDGNGGSKESRLRTSEGMFMTGTAAVHPAIAVLRSKISSALDIPAENLEFTQILRYGEGQRYVPHHDYFTSSDKYNLGRGGQRIATAITWLTSTSDGSGSTSFPIAGVQFSPAAGDTIIFYNVDDRGREDQSSLHGGDPPSPEQVKWAAVVWAHARNFNFDVPSPSDVPWATAQMEKKEFRMLDIAIF